MSQEYNEYDHVRALVAELRNDGLEGHANTLMDDMVAGSTGTEIFMRLRYHVLELIAFPETASSLTIANAREMYRRLNSKLE